MDKVKYIRVVDEEAGKMLAAIAKHDRRSEGNAAALLFREKYALMFSQPRDDVLVSDAIPSGRSEVVAG